MNSKLNKPHIFSHLILVVYGLLCIVPFILIVSTSFSNENDVLTNGFSFLPQHFTAVAYKYVFKNAMAILRAYGITIIFAFGGSFLAILLMTGLGYSLSREFFILRKPVAWILIFTMFFNGGLVPNYIIRTQVYHLGNSIWIYLTDALVTAYTVFVFRTFFSQVPKSLIEAAELDGASEFQVLRHVMLPLSTAVLATYTFMQVVIRWNDFSVCMYYIQDTNLYSLQYMLQEILNEAQYLTTLKQVMPGAVAGVELPSETLKYALCVVISTPMFFVFPFFQKYFTKGMVVGSVKG